jgi:hypothetical protein
MTGKVRIPRRIGAIKVSKKVRKKVRKAVKAAASPFVRDFATAAMAAAGRARRERPRGDESNGGTENERKAVIMCGETRVHIEGSKVAEAFRAAAIDGFRRFLEGFEEGLRKAQENDGPQAAPKAKPRAKARPKAAAARKARATGPAKRPPRSPAPGA